VLAPGIKYDFVLAGACILQGQLSAVVSSYATDSDNSDPHAVPPLLCSLFWFNLAFIYHHSNLPIFQDHGLTIFS
jgi:hypothetical protein